MTGEEVKDLFIATHQIVPAIERHYDGTATNIAIQDGKEAGQSVEVCMYVLLIKIFYVCICITGNHFHFKVYGLEMTRGRSF